MPPVSDHCTLHWERAGDLSLYMKDVSIYISRELTDLQRSSKKISVLYSEQVVYFRSF